MLCPPTSLFKLCIWILDSCYSVKSFWHLFPNPCTILQKRKKHSERKNGFHFFFFATGLRIILQCEKFSKHHFFGSHISKSCIYLSPIWLCWSEDNKNWNGPEDSSLGCFDGPTCRKVKEAKIKVKQGFERSWQWVFFWKLTIRKSIFAAWFCLALIWVLWGWGWGFGVFLPLEGIGCRSTRALALGAALARGATYMHSSYTCYILYSWYSWHG